MNCQQVRERMLDLVSAPRETFPDAYRHLHDCPDCTRRLEELRGTLSLLDEWTTPEPSPFFNARLGARLREEAERPHSLLERLRTLAITLAIPTRKAAAAVVVILLLVGGTLMFRGGRDLNTSRLGTQVAAERGTAVGDLQVLDKDEDLYAEFDLLDTVPSDSNNNNVTP